MNSSDTPLHGVVVDGVEVELCTARPDSDAGLQIPVQNLYAVGDGAGIA